MHKRKELPRRDRGPYIPTTMRVRRDVSTHLTTCGSLLRVQELLRQDPAQQPGHKPGCSCAPRDNPYGWSRKCTGDTTGSRTFFQWNGEYSPGAVLLFSPFLRRAT